jgi:hypothetical protein
LILHDQLVMLERESSGDDSVLIGIAVGVGLLFLIMAAIMVFLLFRQKRNTAHSAHNSDASNLTDSISLTLQLKSTLTDIKIEELLGSGNFGELLAILCLTKLLNG